MGPPTVVRNHDVTRDGSALIGFMAAGDKPDSGARSSMIYVVLNWFEELKARVPVQ
jgi:hypothetical protein